jgi:hypothetical protein
MEDRKEDANQKRRCDEGTRQQRCRKKYKNGERDPARAIPRAVEEHPESFVRAKRRGDGA